MNELTAFIWSIFYLMISIGATAAVMTIVIVLVGAARLSWRTWFGDDA